MITVSVCQNNLLLSRLSFWGRLEKLIWRYPSFNSQSQATSSHTDYTRPFSDRSRFSINGYLSARRSIASLGCPTSPYAVFRRIRSIIVNALKRHSWWSLSHIREKICCYSPAFANRDSPASISSIIFIFMICTAHEHPIPCVIGTGAAFAVIAIVKCSDRARHRIDYTSRTKGLVL